MQDHHFETTLEQADRLLQFAEEEYYRPQEDIVLDQIGQHIQNATAHYLAAFLIRHAREVRPTMPITHLLKLCTELEPKFHKLEIDTKLIEPPSLLDHNDINQALALAKKIGDISRINQN